MNEQAQSLNYNVLLQRFFLSPAEKANKDRGKAIMKAFYTQQTAQSNANSNSGLNYFSGRNARWAMLMQWAKGAQNTSEFLDYMNVVDGNKAWVNMDMTPTRIAAQFVGTLLESMAKNKTYPCVNAVDDGSISEKEQRMAEAIFRMREVETINQFQQEMGVQLEPTNAFVPDDEISARVHFELEDRLPKEIRFEEMLAKLQSDIQFERILNRKSIYDFIVLNCGVTKIERIAAKKYTIRKCIAPNVVYNFFMNDNGDCEIDIIGEFYNLKVKDFRSKFGKTEERPDGLTEKQIFDLAKMSTQKNVGTYNYVWNENWALTTYNNQTRPYDDCSVLVLDTEINFEEDQYYVSKKDAFGKENIQGPKRNIPYQQITKSGEIIEQPKPEGTEIIKKKKNTWMRGVYCPYGDVLLYWGEPDLIITPYTNVAKPLSSYSINIPNNDGDYVPSLFERVMEPLREYQLTKLKRKQLIAKVKPSGIRIDVESARNIDLGGGDTIAWEEVMRIYDQTGNEVWSSKGLDPLSREAPPLSNTVRNETINDIIGLTNILLGIVAEIRQLIGVPQYRDGSDVGDRTSGVLQEQQNIASYNVTDFILNANNQLWEESFYKICLLHWNDIVKEEPETEDDMINTRFDVTVKMKISDYQKQLLEKDISMYSQVPDKMGNPSITLKDAMMIREIDNYKLACWYLTATYEKNRRQAIEESIMLQKENAAEQQKSLMAKAEQDAKLQTEVLAAERETEEFKATKQKEIKLLEGFLNVCAKDETGQLIRQFMPAIQQLVPNITIPLAVENKNMQEDIQAEEEAKAQEQMIMQESQRTGIPPEQIAQQMQQGQPQ